MTEINPVIGVRNQRIECLLEEITTKLGYHWRFTGFDPTLRLPLGYLLPEKGDWRWTFDLDLDNAAVADDMVSAIKTYGRPFMEEYVSLPAITDVLTDPERYNYSTDVTWRRPLAFYLVGDYEKAEQYLTGRNGVPDTAFRAELRHRMVWIRGIMT